MSLPNPFFVYPDTNPLPWRWRCHAPPKRWTPKPFCM